MVAVSVVAAWLVPGLVFVILIALCASKKDKRKKKENGGGEDGDLEVGPNASSITLVSTMPGETNAEANASSSSSNHNNNNNNSSSSFVTSSSFSAPANPNTAAATTFVTVAAPPPAASTTISAANAEAALRRFSDLPAGVSVSLMDSGNGGFLPLDGLPANFPGSSTDFSAFGDMKKKPAAAPATAAPAAGANGTSALHVYGTAADAQAVSAMAARAPSSSTDVPSYGGMDMETIELQFVPRLKSRLSMDSVQMLQTLDLDYEYVPSRLEDKYRRESESDGFVPSPQAEGDIYSSAADYPGPPPKTFTGASSDRQARLSVVSTGSVFSESSDDADPAPSLPASAPFSSSSTTTTATTTATTTTAATTTTTTTKTAAAAAPAHAPMAAAGGDIYEDLSSDPVAQRAARNSISFAQKAQHTSMLAAAAAAAKTAAAATAAAISGSRPSTVVEEGGDMYVNMREAHAAAASFSSSSSSIPAAPAASAASTMRITDSETYEDMSDANLPRLRPQLQQQLQHMQPSSTASYKVITVPDVSAAEGGEMYVDMSAAKPHTGFTDRYEIVELPAGNKAKGGNAGALPPGFIPPAASGTKAPSHSYINTKDGTNPSVVHNYVNTAPGGGPPAVAPAAAVDESDDGNYGRLLAPKSGGSAVAVAAVVDHEYGNLSPKGTPLISASQGEQHSYGNTAAVMPRQTSTVSATSDSLYVNNEASRKEFASSSTTATGSSGQGGSAPSSSADGDASQRKVVAVPAEFYTNMGGRAASDEWLVAPMDTARYKALSQNKQPHSAVPEVVRNKKYNRHLDVLPNPATRVPLSYVRGDPTSQYINANFIRDGAGNAHAYICTQAPQELTVTHFWRMIWEHKVPFVVMATGLVEKGEEKSQQYWPDEINLTIRFLDIVVTLVESTECNGYIRNVMEVECDGEVRQVTQWWFRAWPDHGVPRANGKPDPSQCIEMLLEIRRARKELESPAPVLVHCSAGVGRSGSLIAMDVCMSLLEQTGHVDVCYVVYMIRHDRVALVQHPQQYELVHAACHFFAQLQGTPTVDSPDAIMSNDGSLDAAE